MLLVSIIIPIYNVEQYVERCLKSVMAQTYTNIECLLVDDCTPDNSIILCEQLITQYTGSIQFKILHHDRNRGLSAARNTGTKSATGTYLYYLDSDDEITPDCIQILINETLTEPAAEMICADCIEPYEGPRRCYHIKERTHLTSNSDIRYRLFCQEQTIPVMAWNKLIRSSFLEENGISFKEGILHEDLLWIYDVAMKLKDIVLIPEQTHIYHLNNQSIVQNSNIKKRSQSMVKIITSIIKKIDGPFYELAVYKYLLRLFVFYKHTAYYTYQPAVNVFCKKLWKIGDRRSAIATRLFFVFNKTHRLTRTEQRLTNRLAKQYYHYHRNNTVSTFQTNV